MQSLVDDIDAMCGIITNKVGDDELTAQARRLKDRLGQPTDPGDIGIAIGEQGASMFSLLLEGREAARPFTQRNL